MATNHNPILTTTAITAAASAFGTAILMPALREWTDVTVLWWLLYIVVTSMAVGSGKQQLSSGVRFSVSFIAVLMPLGYVALNILILGRKYYMSGLNSDNRSFWLLIGAFTLITWALVWLFSYSQYIFRMIVSWVDSSATEPQIVRISRVLTAIVGLIGAAGLLVKAFIPDQ